MVSFALDVAEPPVRTTAPLERSKTSQFRRALYSANTRVRKRVRKETEKIKQAAVKAPAKNPFIVDPRTSVWLPWWDAVTGLALIFTAIFTPYEVAYLPPPSGPISQTREIVVFWTNRFVDVIFLLDVLLNFFLAYPADAEQSSEGAHWVTIPSRIRYHYLCGWFAVDIVSTATSIFDLVDYFSDGEGLTKFMVLRVVRAARLLKLMRLVRGQRLLRRWETRVSIKYSFLSLANSMLFVVLFAHWAACAWMLQVSFRNHLEETWLYNAQYCIQTPPADLDRSMLTDTELRELDRYTAAPPIEGDFLCMEHLSIFAAAFYMQVMTITSVGYGDIVATPRQPSEQVVATMLMLGGAFVWSQVVAVFCGVIATMSPATTDFHLTMDSLNSYMQMNDLPQAMRQRLRDYFHRTRHLWRTNASRDVLMRMSPTLQGEVLLQTNAAWLSKVSWLAKEDPRFLTEVILSLKPAVFAPKEVVGSSALHIVNLGCAIHGGHLLRSGDVWGQDMLLAARHLRARTLVRAITYLEVFFIERDELLNIAANGFAESLERIRRRTRYLALRRAIVLIAKVSRGLTHHRRREGVTPAALAAAACHTGGNIPRARWRVATNMVKAMQTAQRSFKRNHQEYVGAAPGVSMEMNAPPLERLGSELDQRVEASRETHLCNTLFQLAASATSSTGNLALGLGAAAAQATSNAPSAAPGASRAEPESPPPQKATKMPCRSVLQLADGSPIGRSQSKLPVVNGTEVNASFKKDRETSSPNIAAPPRVRAASCSTTAEQQKEASGSFVKRGVQQGMQKMRSVGRSGQMTKGMEALTARVDALTASNEAMRSEFRALSEMMMAAAASANGVGESASWWSNRRGGGGGGGGGNLQA